MSKNSRNEFIEGLVVAVRASQTATEMLDAAIADYLGVNDTDYRCIDILDQEGPMTAGRLAQRARLSPAAIDDAARQARATRARAPGAGRRPTGGRCSSR